MMNFVPISLIVSLELVKFFQGMLIQYDITIYDEDKDIPAKVQSSNLNEELGMVNYIFSDKTGTLTQNIMDFKKFSAGLHSYGSNDQMAPSKLQPGVTNVNFEDPSFWEEWKETTSPNHKHLTDFINILAICHTIIVEDKDGVISYNASSPDELALTNAARHFGVIFENRDEDSNMVIYNVLENKRYKY